MPIAEGIAAAKAAVDVTKIVTDLVYRPNPDAAEIQRKVHEMLIHLVNAQTALSEAQLEIGELRNEIDSLKAEKTLADALVYVENVYWKRLAEDSLDGPFCPQCWHSPAKRLSRMRFLREDTYTIRSAAGRRMRKYDCLLHGGETKASEYLIPSEMFAYVKLHWSPPPERPVERE